MVRARIDPNLLRQTLNAAIAAHQQGRLPDAEKGYARVLKALPDQPDALNLLGLLNHQQGRNARAVPLLQRAIATRPDLADAHNHLGLAQRKLGRAKEAAAAFAEAARLKPDMAEAHNNLGNALMDIGDSDGAQAAYRRACQLAARAVEPRYNLANLLRDGEQHDEALALYAEVAALAPQHLEARFNLAGLLERRHELATAERELRGVLAANAGLAPAIILLTKVLRRQKRWSDALAVIESLPKTVSGDDAIAAAFELGRLHDAMEDTEAAFKSFALGNVLQAEAVGPKLMRDAERFRAGVASSTEWLRGRDKGGWAGRDGSDIVFLIGFPRSGTTLLDQVLDAHPDVQVMEERPAVAAVVDAARDLRIDLPAALDGLAAEHADALRAAYWAEVARHVQRQPDTILVDKMPLNIVHAPLLARLFPAARYVLALRHPMDVVLSNFMQQYRLNGAMANFLTLETAAQAYDLVMRHWQAARDRLGLKAHEVRYEALVTDLEGEAKALTGFLGLDWTDAVLDPSGHARARKVINTPSYEQVAEPIYTRASGRWVRYRTQLLPVAPTLDDWVEQLGYRQ